MLCWSAASTPSTCRPSASPRSCHVSSAHWALPAVGLAARLPRGLGTLGEAGGAERVALGDQAARRVDDPAAAIRRVAVVDEPRRVALVAEAERLVDEQLVRAEAVVQLDDSEVLRAEPGLLVDRARGADVHVVADHVLGRA